MTEIVATKVITCGRKARKYVLQGSGFGFCSNFQQGVKREVSYNKDKIQRVNQSLQYFMGLRLIPFQLEVLVLSQNLAGHLLRNYDFEILTTTPNFREGNFFQSRVPLISCKVCKNSPSQCTVFSMTFQLCNIAMLQLSNFPTLQHCKLATLQLCNFATLNIATL